MNVFVSWSGIRSKAFAEKLHAFLERILHPLKPWMSSKDIEKGSKWSEEIGNRLADHDFGIICVTPENQNSPWLMFEAGALSKTLDTSRIFPVLIGMEPSDLISPLNQYQATTLLKTDFLNFLKALNKQLDDLKIREEILEEEFELKWDKFYSSVEETLNQIHFKSSSKIFPQILEALKQHGLPQPESGTTVQFSEGFESHAVYESAFKNAQKRLYIYGRKNRKVFDKEHWWFYEELNKKKDNGLDFKCLFLDPQSSNDVIGSAHADEDFLDQLNACIENATKVLGRFGVVVSEHLRYYGRPRAFSIVVVDDAILFRPIEYDSNGKAKRLTKSSFTLTSTSTSVGKSLEENFIAIWDSSKSALEK